MKLKRKIYNFTAAGRSFDSICFIKSVEDEGRDSTGSESEIPIQASISLRKILIVL